MNYDGIKLRIENKEYLNKGGIFNLDKALTFSGHIGGICYDPQGYDHCLKESKEKTEKRVKNTIESGHHSVFGQVDITIYIKGLSKILAMMLNNEHEYSALERSLRYTAVTADEKSIISEEEVHLYNKWLNIFKLKINEKFPNVYTEKKVQSLAQENARAMVTVFMPTEMVYTTSLRQLNYIASWMFEFIAKAESGQYEPWMYKYIDKEKNSYLNTGLVCEMKKFLYELDRLNLLVPGLMKNEKNRGFSLFGKNLDKRVEYFGDVYLAKYKGTFAEVAQAQRHRTLDYQIEIPKEVTFAIPELIKDDPLLAEEWIRDISSVKDIIPIGQLVQVVEMGKYEDFILKCKERLCSAAQLEIMQITRETLLKYQAALIATGHPLAEDIEKYTHGARCTFPDFTCTCPCGKAKIIDRKI